VRSVTFALVCGMVFFIPWEEVTLFPGAKTYVFMLGCAALGASVVAVVLNPRLRRPPLVLVFLALFLLWSYLSISWSLDPSLSLSRGMTNLSLFLFAWLIWEFTDSEKRFLWLCRCYIFGACISLGAIFVAFVSGRNIYTGYEVRYTGGGLNQNDIATVLNIAIAMAAYLASRPSSKGTIWRNAYWAFIPAAGMGILLTGSRTGFLVLGLVLAALLLASRFGGVRALLALIVFVSCGAVLAPIIVPEGLLDRVMQGTGSKSFQQRVEYWKAGLGYWSEHPLEGAGANCFTQAAETRIPNADVSHNTFVTILVEEGVIGFGIMLVVWFMLFKAAIGMRKQERLLWLTILGVWCVSSMTLTWECNKSSWMIYAGLFVHRAIQQQAVPRIARVRQNGRPNAVSAGPR
jgi:O-antigen ligase